jgi:hypothetical protein
MSRTIKMVLVLAALAVLWKLLFTSPSDVEYEYDPNVQ